MFYRINKPLAAVILLLTVCYGCKREDLAHVTNEKTTFLEKAKQFVKKETLQADYQKLDWTKAVIYKRESNNTIIRVPLLGNTRPEEKSIYLTYNKDSFSGNYFELTGSTITTLSLNNIRKCVANAAGG